MTKGIAALAALVTFSCAHESSWHEVNEPAPDFTLVDRNPDSPDYGESRSVSGQAKILVLYFGSYG